MLSIHHTTPKMNRGPAMADRKVSMERRPQDSTVPLPDTVSNLMEHPIRDTASSNMVNNLSRAMGRVINRVMASNRSRDTVNNRSRDTVNTLSKVTANSPLHKAAMVLLPHQGIDQRDAQHCKGFKKKL